MYIYIHTGGDPGFATKGGCPNLGGLGACPPGKF